MRRQARGLALVWFTAFNLRAVIFGIPPVLPAIRSDLGLSFSVTGSITSAFLIALAAGSIPGALLVARVPARRVVAVASLGLGAFAVARLLPPGVLWVYGGTVLLTLAVSIAQPAMAVLVRRWFPDGITRASNLYSNGLLIGNVGGSSLTPVLAAVTGWRGTFLVWGGCALTGAALWARFAPGDPSPPARSSVGAALRDPRSWQITALFVFQNLAYYTVTTWLPFLVRGHGALAQSLVYLCLNCFPVVPLLVLPLLRWDYPLSAAFYVGAGLLTTAGSAGMLLGLADVAWLLALAVGLGCGAAFVAALTLPSLLARDEAEAAGLSAVVFTFGYLLSFVGPLAAGVLADRSGAIGAAFWPAVAAGLLMTAIGSFGPRLLIRSHGRPAGAAEAEAEPEPAGRPG